jgi:hypothetical protein
MERDRMSEMRRQPRLASEEASTGFLLPCMIRAPYQGTRLHMPEAEGQTLPPQLLEFLRSIDTQYREMPS